MSSIRHFGHTAAGPVALTLHLGSGLVDVHATSAITDTATVELTAHPDTDAAATVAAAYATHHDAHFVVETPAFIPAAACAHLFGDAATPTRFDHQVAVRAAVPPYSALTAHADGPIRTLGPLGHVDIATVAPARVRAATRADIATDTGDIVVGAAAELTAVTRTGDITAAVTGPTVATVSRRGDITLDVYAAAHITAATVDGRITVRTHVPGVTTDLRADHGTTRVLRITAADPRVQARPRQGRRRKERKRSTTP